MFLVEKNVNMRFLFKLNLVEITLELKVFCQGASEQTDDTGKPRLTAIHLFILFLFGIKKVFLNFNWILFSPFECWFDRFRADCADMRPTLVPGLSPLSWGGVTWVLWCSALCSARSLTYRKWRRHLSQLSVCFFCRQTQDYLIRSPGCTALISCSAAVYLMAGNVLLVAAVAVQNSEAVLTQQLPGVTVNLSEVRPGLGVEGRPKLTHLQTQSRDQIYLADEGRRMKRSLSRKTPGRRRASLLVCGCSSCDRGGQVRCRTPAHRSYISLQQETNHHKESIDVLLKNNSRLGNRSCNPTAYFGFSRSAPYYCN